jgi:5-methyltetrahydropteroyltriglutamate--homocysteine methyltransferase
MRRSTNRILVSHAGVLPRPASLLEAMRAGPSGDAKFKELLPGAVKDIVKQQVDCGFDVVNDGEFSKRGGFSGYPRERLSGLEARELKPGEGPPPHDVQGRDKRDFPEFGKLGFPARAGGPPTGNAGGTILNTGTQGNMQAGGGAMAGSQPGARTMVFCTAPVKFIGQDQVNSDIANIKAAIEGYDIEGYLPAVAPGTMEHWLRNEHYKNDEEFLFAIADAMHEEYKMITDAGLILQIDDPDLPDGWQMYPELTVPEYRAYADLRVEALNHGLRGIPESQVRFHTCWGSQHGPHMDDIELKHFVDIMFKIKAECFSVEAANPQHDADWLVYENFKLPAGKSYMPGVVSHASNHIEHPEVVAQRLLKYASLMGRENVIAGTDCGMASRVGHPEVCWAKFRAEVAGAKLASERLWK